MCSRAASPGRHDVGIVVTGRWLLGSVSSGIPWALPIAIYDSSKVEDVMGRRVLGHASVAVYVAFISSHSVYAFAGRTAHGRVVSRAIIHRIQYAIDRSRGGDDLNAVVGVGDGDRVGAVHYCRFIPSGVRSSEMYRNEQCRASIRVAYP